MSEQPDLSTLPQRMRYAAKVQREATKRYSCEVDATKAIPWGAAGLENWARRWEAEDREAAALDGQVETLAQELHDMQRPFHTPGPFASAWEQLNHRIIARRLIDSGWRKADPA